jgi:xanthosine utilization system XapX-like protein
MNAPSLDIDIDALAPASLRGQVLAWWYSLPQALRSPTWPASLAALTILGLLLGFHHVVVMSVQQGELLRMSTANHAQAVWRCQALQGARARASCIEQIDAPTVATAEAPPPNPASLQVAQWSR